MLMLISPILFAKQKDADNYDQRANLINPEPPISSSPYWRNGRVQATFESYGGLVLLSEQPDSI